jgi:hypothetical protein
MRTLIASAFVVLCALPAHAEECQGDVYGITQDWLKQHYGVSQCDSRYPVPDGFDNYWYCYEPGTDDWYLIREAERWRPGEYSQAFVTHGNDPDFGMERFNCTCFLEQGDEACYSF